MIIKEDVKELVEMVESKKYRIYEIAEWFGIHKRTVRRVYNRYYNDDVFSYKKYLKWCKDADVEALPWAKDCRDLSVKKCSEMGYVIAREWTYRG